MPERDASPRVVRAQRIDAAVQVPVAIVGGGACGLTAAIALRDRGIDCVVLERDPAPSGSTALSSGFIPAAGTRAQARQGLADSPEAFAQDISAKAKGRAAGHLVQAYTQAIAPALDCLEDHGLRWSVLDGFLYPGHHALRMHTLPERTGAALVAALAAAAVREGADILTDACVTELWMDDADRIIGLGYLRPDGVMERVACDAVILACNGFGGNPALVREYLPELRDALFAGHAGNDGSAIAWGRALGAGLADLGGYQGHGSWVIPQGALMTWAVIMQGGIQVNAQGQRFHDESQGYSEAAVAVLAQPGQIAWNVFDDPLLALAREFPDFRDAEAAGAVRTAAGVQALAALIGCDAAVLAQTVASVHADALAPDGRRFTRALAPPFHAVKVTGALFHTQGGLDVDAQCRVRRVDGWCWPNLMAGGGAARGVSGDAVWGYLSGNGLLSAVAGGWICADTAAHWISKRHEP